MAMTLETHAHEYVYAQLNLQNRIAHIPPSSCRFGVTKYTKNMIARILMNNIGQG